MNRFQTAAIAILVSAQPVLAADYRVPFSPPPLEPIAPPPTKTSFDWSRCYAGAQAGMKIVDNQIKFGRTEWYVAEQIKTTSDTLPGPVIGGQAGCNHLLNNGFLVGVELEGLWGPKKQIDCSSQVDPVAQCVELRKRLEGFASLRLGYVVDNSFLCDCLNGLMMYGRLGVGYTHTDVKMNVNTVSYRTVPGGTGANAADFYVPQYAQDYNLAGSSGMFGPLIGFGFERAIGHNWTARVDMSAMATVRSDMKARVTDGKFYGATAGSRTPGGALPEDSTGLVRNPRVGDVLQVKMQEVETRLTFGVNRLF
jgi:opacity protein-like surface antigen